MEGLMALKVHMMGPNSDKFPFKPQGSWFFKLDNKTHDYLKQRCKENGETLEQALLATVMEGVDLVKKDRENATGTE
jgi:hypothetical protein